MRKLVFFAIVSMAAAAFSAASNAESRGDSAKPGPAVITLDYQGSRLQRLTDQPTLSIFADGSVVMPKVYAHSRAYSGSISQAELQGLLGLIQKNEFFAFDESAVKSKVWSLPVPYNDLPGHLASTVITVRSNAGSKTVSYFGLGHEPLVKETEQLLAIRNRLDQVMSVMKLGGQAEANRWLALANADLGSKLPNVVPLTLDDLRSAAIHGDGSAYVRFARANPESKSSISVSISINESGESSIAIARDDLLSRSPNQVR